MLSEIGRLPTIPGLSDDETVRAKSGVKGRRSPEQEPVIESELPLVGYLCRLSNGFVSAAMKYVTLRREPAPYYY